MRGPLQLNQVLIEEYEHLFLDRAQLHIPDLDPKNQPFQYQNIEQPKLLIERLLKNPPDPEARYLLSVLSPTASGKLKSFCGSRQQIQEVSEILRDEINSLLQNPHVDLGPLVTSLRLSDLTKHLLKKFRDSLANSPFLKRLVLSDIFPDHLETLPLDQVYKLFHALPDGPVALCLSGGGIRSATFALGLMQSLARLNLMKRFDYLSTVSGGGYIGSWLSACIKQEGCDRVFDSLGHAPCDRKKPIEHPLDSDPKEIAHLRRFRNYLIPNWGLFSPDAWALVATYCRNLFLNWLTLIPALVCALALVRLDLLFLLAEDIPGIGLCGGFWTGTILTIWSIGFLSHHLRSTRIETAASQQHTDCRLQQTLFHQKFIWGGLVPLACASFILALFWARARMNAGAAITCGTDFFQSWWNSWILWKLPMPFEVHPANFALFAIFVHFSGVLVRIGLGLGLGRTKTSEPDKLKKEKHPTLTIAGEAILVVMLILVSLISGLATYLAATNLFLNPKNTPFAYAVFAAPLLLAILLLGLDILVGLRSRWNTDAERERKARLNGFVLRGCLLWVVISTLVLYGPGLIAEFNSVLMSSIGGLSGLLALLLGFSGGTKAISNGEEKESRLDATKRISLSVAAPIGVMFVVVLVSGLTSFLILKTGPTVLSGFKLTPNAEQFGELVRTQLDMSLNSQDASESSSAIYHLIQIRQLTTQLQSMKEPYDTCEMVTMLQHLNKSFTALDRIPLMTSRVLPALDTWTKQVQVVWPDIHGSEAKAVGTLCELKQEASTSFQKFAAVHSRVVTDAHGYVLLCLFSGCLFLALVMPFASSINTFSLHTLYRERLVRTFLGASRTSERAPDAFTGLDPADNFSIADLAAKGVKPFHVVNAAINLLSTENQAWTNRKSASFTFSPLHSGSPVPSLGYRRSEEYGRNEATKRSVSLGTALAISGAAASPNMGYHSSPAVTFLMTLFNVRLGWWLGNPGQAGNRTALLLGESGRPAWQRSAPIFTLIWWVKEALGLTREDNAYVYLSDGGHFENLGLYEMVLRRCRCIVVSDAGCDPTYGFEDLGNVLRKIRVDLGIDIEIDLEMVRPQAGQRLSRWHHAIGTIRYDKVDKHAPVGILVYIKASLTGDEPADIQEYASAHVEFPHQSTSDQFFDEAQFESYRQLGEQVGREVFNPIASHARDDQHHMPAIFYALRSHWMVLPPGIRESFLQETTALIDIEQQLRDDPHLVHYDTQLYPELKTILGISDSVVAASAIVPSPTGQRERSLLHLCHAQIQLMENVFLAVQLDKYHAHPLNRGWMNLFRRWAVADDFRQLWPVLRGGFSKAFVDFVGGTLSLDQNAPDVIYEVTRDGAGILQPPFEVFPEQKNVSDPPIDFALLMKEFVQEWPIEIQKPDFLASFQRAGLPGQPPIIVAVPPRGVKTTEHLFGVAFAVKTHEVAESVECRIFVWIRGAHRRLGIGGKLLEHLLNILPAYLGATKERTLVVVLPELPRDRPGYALEKAGWLHFFGRRRFRLLEETERYRLERVD